MLRHRAPLRNCTTKRHTDGSGCLCILSHTTTALGVVTFLGSISLAVVDARTPWQVDTLYTQEAPWNHRFITGQVTRMEWYRSTCESAEERMRVVAQGARTCTHARHACARGTRHARTHARLSRHTHSPGHPWRRHEHTGASTYRLASHEKGALDTEAGVAC